MYKKLLSLSLVVLLVLACVSSAQAFSPFKFAVIADPHMSVASDQSPENSTKMFKKSVELLQTTVAEINKQGDIDFVVALGDLTKDAEPWNVDRFKEVMDELKMPWYVVLGNHDISPIDTAVKQTDPGVTRATMIWTFQGHGYNGPDTHWSVDPLPGIHLVGLDTSMTGDWGGQLSQAGLNFLERDLAANAGKLTIVILHHQLLPYTTAEETGENDFHKFVAYNAEEVRNTLRLHPQVVMTLSGHRHISTRYKMEDHIAYFTMPSTMTWPMRYAIFEMDQEKLVYNTYDVPCKPEVWEGAKQNAMAVEVTSWPRTSETPNTPEGNKLLEEIMLSEGTKSGEIKLHQNTTASLMY